MNCNPWKVYHLQTLRLDQLTRLRLIYAYSHSVSLVEKKKGSLDEVTMKSEECCHIRVLSSNK